jgi:outer membrane protein assembly factor BamB
MIHPHITMFLALCGCFVAYKPASAENWWQFRGPHSGHTTATKLPTRWGGFFDEPCWKTSLPGKGWSSPIVVNDQIWLTAAEQVALDTTSLNEKLAELPLNPRDLVTHASVRLIALAVDAQTGQMVREIELFKHANPPPIHSMNSYASPTPATDGERVYCHFGALGTACVSIDTGNVLWRRELVVDEITGGAASPVLWQDNVILACDGADQQFLTALDKMTGETRWLVKRPPITVADDMARRSFSTPVIVDGLQGCQLISLAAQWLVSYNPVDGSERWRARLSDGYSAVPTPVVAGDRVFVCTGFTDHELVAVDITGTGDVTDTAIAWRTNRQSSEISSPIIVGDEIYFASSQGMIKCLDHRTGALHWQERVGGNFVASPTLADGKLFFTNHSGVTTVLQPGKKYVEIAKNELFGESYASLAVYKQSFLLRTHPYLFRLESP